MSEESDWVNANTYLLAVLVGPLNWQYKNMYDMITMIDDGRYIFKLPSSTAHIHLEQGTLGMQPLRSYTKSSEEAVIGVRHSPLSLAKEKGRNAVTFHMNECDLTLTFNECCTTNVPLHTLRDRKEVEIVTSKLHRPLVQASRRSPHAEMRFLRD